MLNWLIGLGGVGLFTVAVVDSSMIPLPLPGSTDFLLLVLVAHGADAVWMTIAATTGAILGGYLTWATGVKGGEAALHRYVTNRLVKNIHRWVENHGGLAIAVSSLLPPPLPILPFLLAAGALGVPRKRFLAFYGTARTARYSLEAWLGATYGRRVLHAWSHYLEDWGSTVVFTFVGLMVAITIICIWRWRKKQQAAPSASYSRT
jgi:membrane protein YqaA with SNARE-associated domain